MKALVNDKCEGSGLCADTCPDVFEMNDSGKAAVKVDAVPEGSEASCRQAATECPLQAIEVRE